MPLVLYRRPSMNRTRTILTLALSLSAPLAVAGCDKKSGGETVASATATATAAPAPSCPSGSAVAGNFCKAAGQSRIATITWAGAVSDSGPTLTAKNTSSFGLKNATVSLWFYDRSGKRLDVAGTKKYSSSADVLGGTFAAGASKDTTFNFLKANIPTGTAEIEGEIVAATLVKSDGTEGLTWKNDDLNADDRAMAGTPPAGGAAAFAATPATTAAVAGTTKPTATVPGHKPAAPAPPAHR
jgi:hypothetical protein